MQELRQVFVGYGLGTSYRVRTASSNYRELVVSLDIVFHERLFIDMDNGTMESDVEVSCGVTNPLKAAFRNSVPPRY